jgi:hypothetical protein
MGILNKIRNGLYPLDRTGWGETPRRRPDNRPPSRTPVAQESMQPYATNFHPQGAGILSKIQMGQPLGSGLPAHYRNPYFDRYLGPANLVLDPIQQLPNYQTELPIYTRKR